MKTATFFTILFFIGINSALGQSAGEVKTEQKKVIAQFFQLLHQDSPVTVTQSYTVFNPEET